jgi:hypothetical protein
MEPTEDKRIEKIRKAQQVTNAYHRLFNSDEGKIVLADLRQSFGLDQPAFIPFATQADGLRFDPLAAAIRDGQRQVDLHIRAKLAAKPDGDENAAEKAAKKPRVRK